MHQIEDLDASELERLVDEIHLDDVVETIERTSGGERIADAVAKFVGTWFFAHVHALWFAVWIFWNVSLCRRFGRDPFDPFPFGLLTMVVSLEAIFLSCLLLIAGQRQSEKDRLRSECAYRTQLDTYRMVLEIRERVDDPASRT